MNFAEEDKKTEYKAIRFLENINKILSVIFIDKDYRSKLFFNSSLLFDKCIYRNIFYKNLLIYFRNDWTVQRKKINYIYCLKVIKNIIILIFFPTIFIIETLYYFIIIIFLKNKSHILKRRIFDSKDIYFIYPDDENNNFTRSRYFRNIKIKDIRISLGKSSSLISKLINLKLLINRNLNVFPLEAFMEIKDLYKIFFITFKMWLKSILSINAYLILKIKSKKFFKHFKLIERRILIILNLFKGSSIRRQLVLSAIHNIINTNEKNIHFPVEGAYWEIAFLNFSKQRSKSFNGYVNSIPKIFDSRLKIYNKLNILFLLENIHYKFPFIREYIDRRKNFAIYKDLNKLNKTPIKNNDILLFILTGFTIHDDDFMQDIAYLRLKKPDCQFKIKPHPESNIQNIIRNNRFLNFNDFVNDIKYEYVLICSIYSSYSFEINRLENNKKFMKFKLFTNKNLYPYLDPHLIDKLFIFQKIEEII